MKQENSGSEDDDDDYRALTAALGLGGNSSSGVKLPESVMEGEMVWLDEMLHEALDEEAFEDPDFENDPINKIELKEFLVQFLQALAKQNMQALTIIANSLSADNKNFLKKLLTPK